MSRAGYCVSALFSGGQWHWFPSLVLCDPIIRFSWVALALSFQMPLTITDSFTEASLRCCFALLLPEQTFTAQCPNFCYKFVYDLRMLPKDCVLLVVLIIFNFAFYSSAGSQFSFSSNILIWPSGDLVSLSTFCTVIYPWVGFCLGPFSSNRGKCVLSQRLDPTLYVTKFLETSVLHPFKPLF